MRRDYPFFLLLKQLLALPPFERRWSKKQKAILDKINAYGSPNDTFEDLYIFERASWYAFYATIGLIIFYMISFYPLSIHPSDSLALVFRDRAEGILHMKGFIKEFQLQMAIVVFSAIIPLSLIRLATVANFLRYDFMRHQSSWGIKKFRPNWEGGFLVLVCLGTAIYGPSNICFLVITDLHLEESILSYALVIVPVSIILNMFLAYVSVTALAELLQKVITFFVQRRQL